MCSFSHSALWQSSAWDRVGRRVSRGQLAAGLGDDGQLVPDELPDDRRRKDADLLRADPELEGVAVAERPAPPAGMEGDEAEVSRQARRRHDYVVTLTARVEAPSS
jgi:hypothetical protein